MRLVLDTNVLIAAFRSRTGAAAEVVRLIRRRELTMVATVALSSVLDVDDGLLGPVGDPGEHHAERPVRVSDASMPRISHH
jgi:predicted nucleic acid-binding protein